MAGSIAGAMAGVSGGDAGLPGLILPDWPAPDRVRALSTTRAGGISEGPWSGLNLGDHVGDRPEAVAQNRARLQLGAGLPAKPLWLRQVHGVAIADATVPMPRDATPEADGSFAVADDPGRNAGGGGAVCVVLTADCLPVLLCDRAGRCVAALHAGWRGLAAGIVEAGVGSLVAAGAAPADLLAWLGPAIGPDAYEVGPEVRDVLLAADPGAARAFGPGRADRWQLDLAAAARSRLEAAGLHSIHGGGFCTHGDARFYSHRRDGLTGRQATLIWLA